MGDSSSGRSNWVPGGSSRPDYNSAEDGEAEPTSSGPLVTVGEYVPMSPVSFAQAAYRCENNASGMVCLIG